VLTLLGVVILLQPTDRSFDLGRGTVVVVVAASLKVIKYLDSQFCLGIRLVVHVESIKGLITVP
jgi:hypothetical protein